MMNVTRKSILSGIENTMALDVTPAQLILFSNGVMVQDAFPHLPKQEREFILTGITPDEWNAVFDAAEDDDEMAA